MHRDEQLRPTSSRQSPSASLRCILVGRTRGSSWISLIGPTGMHKSSWSTLPIALSWSIVTAWLDYLGSFRDEAWRFLRRVLPRVWNLGS